MVKKDPVCKRKDCRYHSIRVGSACLGSCSYMDITGHSKLGQMSEKQRRLFHKGKIACPLYEKGSTAPRRRIVDALFPYPAKPNTKAKLPKRAIADRETIRKLYEKGYNDHEIARTVGCTGSSVWAWRRREGLPANCPVGSHVSIAKRKKNEQ